MATAEVPSLTLSPLARPGKAVALQRLRQNYGRQLNGPLAFQFPKTTARVVMNDRTNGKRRRQHVGSTETMAGCHDRFPSRRPVGGEMFLLTSPFTERLNDEPRAARAERYVKTNPRRADCRFHRFVMQLVGK
jgi:hypothetical protein